MSINPFRTRRKPYRSAAFHCSSVDALLSELYSKESDLTYGLYLRSQSSITAKATFFQTLYHKARKWSSKLFGK